MTTFNLNADMAESYGPWVMGNDDDLLPVINSANIACGFHAGDHNIMTNTMRKAAKHQVSIGAHPGFKICMDFDGDRWTCPLMRLNILLPIS